MKVFVYIYDTDLFSYILFRRPGQPASGYSVTGEIRIVVIK